MKKLFILAVLCSLLALLACVPKPTAESVVQDVIEKMGGAEKLAAIEDQVSDWDFVMHVMPPGMPEGDMDMTKQDHMEGSETDSEMTSKGHSMPFRITYKKPNMIRMDVMTEESDIVHSAVYDGTKGSITDMGKQMAMNEAQTQEHATMAKTWIDFLANHTEKGIAIELLEDEMMDDEKCHVLQATDEFGNVSKYYVNAATSYVERQVGEMVNFMGEKEPMYMTFKDYQMVDGELVSHHVAQYKEDGTLLWEVTLKEISHNTGVSAELFASEEMTMK